MSDPNPQNPSTATDAPPATNSPAPTTATPPVIDVQAQIDAALAKKDADFAAQLEQLTGHKDLKSFHEARLKEQGKLQELVDTKATEAAQYKAHYENLKISNELLLAATEALDPDTVLALLQNKASVDGNGKVLVDGKSAK